MFCSKCGAQIDDNAVVCAQCGCPTENASQAQAPNIQAAPYQATNAPVVEAGESPGLSTLSIVFAFLFPIVGLILGIVGCVKYKTQKLKNRCIVAIILSIAVWIFSMFIIMLN